jgi:uncharacterized membrane-anchored protein
MSRLRAAIVVLGMAAALIAAGLSIRAKERVLADGRTLLLELAPVDPRSLIQGDYMALRYAPRALPTAPDASDLSANPTAVMGVGADGVAVYRRLDGGEPLGPDEARLRYRSLPDSFFVEEGTSSVYEQARYGIIRVDERGRSVLVGVADAQGRQIFATR